MLLVRVRKLEFMSTVLRESNALPLRSSSSSAAFAMAESREPHKCWFGTEDAMAARLCASRYRNFNPAAGSTNWQ